MFLHFLAISVLTILTQVGGISYILFLLVKRFYNNKKLSIWHRIGWNTLVFMLIFLFVNIVIVPPLAKQISGRIPLPYFNTKHSNIKPANIFTCLLNRHYVKPGMKDLLKDMEKEMNQGEKQKLQWLYLDANFPFIDGFPLLPHRSHDDGRKLDIAFFYKKKNGEQYKRRVSFLGYGVCEGPSGKEVNYPKICRDKGYWQYNILEEITSQKSIKKYPFDKERNKKILQKLATDKRVRRIFIEPHLKTRLGLGGYSKIRFHGCPAVRHDDHIHIEI